MKTTVIKADSIGGKSEKWIGCVERSSGKKTYRVYVSIPNHNGDMIDYIKGKYDDRMDAIQAYSYIISE